jgi:GDP-L-fucose synthase
MRIIGESGMLGSAIRRAIDKQAVEKDLGWIIAAGRVGGIKDNMMHPAEFIHENLLIYQKWAAELVSARRHKALFFGSSCMYPRDCPQPMKEEYLWTGKLEPTNEAYAVAKLAGLALTQAYRRQYKSRFITAILCNLYGPGDRGLRQSLGFTTGPAYPAYMPEIQAHVIPALIRKFTKAKRDNVPAVQIQGSGKALREFMYVDDAAEAALLLMEHYDEIEPINVGSGQEISIRELVEMVSQIIGYKGDIVYTAGEDGMSRKLLDSSRILGMGWKPKIGLEEGLKRTIRGWIS